MAIMNQPARGDVNWYQKLTDNWNSIQNNLIDVSTITAKGDLLVALAAASVGRFGVGTNGQAVKADSTQTTGLNWTTIASTSAVSSVNAKSTTAISTTSTTLVAMTGMSVSVTTGATSTVFLAFTTSMGGDGTHAPAIGVALLRGTTVLRQVCVSNPFGPSINYPCSLIAVDQPGAGTFTYAIQWAASAGTAVQDLHPYATTGDRELIAVVLPT